MKSFDEIFIDKTKYGVKVQTSEYSELGEHIIIDQGQSQIAGYTDREEGLFEEVPVIVFGDHTRIIKYVDKPFFLGADGVKVLRSKDENANYKYLYYALKNAKIPNTGYNRHFKWLKNIQINYPAVEKQAEIVAILDKVSSVIGKREDELSALDDLIKARFVEMFGDSVANPMKWPIKKLKDLSVQINSGNTPKGGSENYVEEGITFFRSQNVWKDRLEMDDIAYIDLKTHARMKRSSLKHGDILMTKTGRINTENSSLGRAALYMGQDDMANVNGHVYFIRLKEGVNNKFILRILVSPEYRDLIRRVCVGGIDKRQLNKEHIEDFLIICPPKDMIDEYVSFVDQIDKSKFVALLKQANTDSSKMAEVIGVSEAQLRFVINTTSGMGLIKCGSVVIPFDNQISKDTDLYRLYNTNIHKKIVMMKKEKLPEKVIERSGES